MLGLEATRYTQLMPGSSEAPDGTSSAISLARIVLATVSAAGLPSGPAVVISDLGAVDR